MIPLTDGSSALGAREEGLGLEVLLCGDLERRADPVKRASADKGAAGRVSAEPLSPNDRQRRPLLSYARRVPCHG